MGGVVGLVVGDVVGLEVGYNERQVIGSRRVRRKVLQIARR